MLDFLNNTYNQVNNLIQYNKTTPPKVVTKNNYIPQFSSETWNHIASFCSTDTLLNLRLVNKRIYSLVNNNFINNFCDYYGFSNYVAYSLESYNIFIKPRLYDLNQSLLVNEIDSYIKQHNHQVDSKIFAKFLFYTLKDALDDTDKNSTLHTIKFSSYYSYFQLSKCGNYCVTVMPKNKLVLWQLTVDPKIIKLETYTFNGDLKIIKFTPQNNLLISDSENTILYQLHKENDSCYLQELWNINSPIISSRISITPITISYDEKSFILAVYPMEGLLLVQIKDSDSTINTKTMQKSILMIETISIIAVAVNKSMNVVAISNGKTLSILERTNTQQEFTKETYFEICKSLIIRTRAFSARDGITFNDKGDTCIIIVDIDLVMVFKKTADNWHKIMVLNNDVQHLDGFHNVGGGRLSTYVQGSVAFMPYSKSLLLLKRYYYKTWHRTYANYDCHLKKLTIPKYTNDTKVYESTAEEPNSNYWVNSVDKNIVAVVKCEPYYANAHIDYMDDIDYIEHLEDIAYIDDRVNADNTFTVHPTGLSAFIINKKDHTVHMILPKNDEADTTSSDDSYFYRLKQYFF